MVENDNHWITKPGGMFNDTFLSPRLDNDVDDTVIHTNKDREPSVCSGFTLTIEDNNKVREWLDTHNKTCKFYDDGSTPSNPCGAIGGRLTHMFTPTGLGLIITVNCACGENIDLTDVENW